MGFSYFRLCLLLSLSSLASTCHQEEGLPIYQAIPNFEFMNQDSQLISNGNFTGKAYVADFFFTSCPTICPILAQQMLRIHDHFAEDDRLLLLSHTIDPKRDSIPALREYAENLGVTSSKWHFVTGEKSEIYEIAESYFNLAIEDPTLPDGFDHSGRLILVDKSRNIRAFCSGTNAKEVDLMIKKIEKLLYED